MKKRILSTLLALCMALALLPGTGWAVETYSGTCGDNITWRISGDGTLFLDGKGNTPYFGGYYFAEPAPWEKYADSIKTIHVNEGITGINGGAFSGCNSATGIVLPASLQFIGSGAWPTGDKLMYVVTGFNSTNYIEYGGVLYAQNPATSESEVGKGVPSLVCYPPALKYAETSTYTVREGTKAIASYAFEGNKYVKEVVIPNSVQEIGYDAFRSCISLESVQLPKGLTELKGGTFENCISLKEITLPSGIRTVDISAFWFCDNLNTIIIPASVTQFGSDSFGYDGLSEEFNLHKDFYFRGSAPAFNLNGDLSLGGEFSLIRTDIYYPQNASGWDELIQSVGEQEYIKFYPYDWEGEDPAPEVKYSLSYDLNGGSGDVPSSQYYQNGTGLFVSPVVPTREGYTFTGWSDGSKTYQPGDGIIIQDRDVVLTAVWKAGPAVNYDVEKALRYAQEHWNDGVGQCAEFVSRCVQAGKLNINIEKGTGGCYREISKKSGLSMQRLVSRTDSKGAVYVYKSDNSDSLAPGDVVVQWCNTHNIAPHVLLCGGFNHDGIATFYAHNARKNNQIFRFDYKYLEKDEKIYEHTRDCDMGAYVIHLSSLDPNQENKKITTAKIASHCPVELLVAINESILDSRTINGNYTEPYTGAEMIATGTGNDRTVEVNIPGKFIQNNQANIEFFGTDAGSMSLEVEFTYENNDVEEYVFQNVPLSKTTTGYLEDIQPGQMVRLIRKYGAEGESPLEEVWVAYAGETINTATPSRVSDEEKIENAEECDENKYPIQPIPPSSSSDFNSSDYTPDYRIDIASRITGGTVKTTPASAKKGAIVTLTTTPDEGYELSNLTVTDNKGDELELTDKGNGKYNFIMPSGKVKVEAAFVPIAKEKPDVPESVVLPFTDVFAGEWFYDSVEYAYGKGLMTGDGNLTTFNPRGGMTRAMVWTVLGRMAGADVDGSGGEWYAKARDWAAASGISDGSNPNGGITRQELAVMLWRSAGSPEGTASLGAFSDGGDVAGWASAAMQWAAANGILNGDNGMLKPGAPASRAEVAAMLMRFCEKTGR